ncbi:MAG: RNHCP domain-containing protein [Dehalococcoidia bacterium]
MSRATENTGFTCDRCGAEVAPLRNGSYRNHCPYCLYSKHVDVQPGDRVAACHGPMAPVALDYHSRKGFVIVHRCLRCGVTRRNRVADDSAQPDDVDTVIGLMRRAGR